MERAFEEAVESPSPPLRSLPSDRCEDGADSSWALLVPDDARHLRTRDHRGRPDGSRQGGDFSPPFAHAARAETTRQARRARKLALTC
jgi:hypothetical protein